MKRFILSLCFAAFLGAGVVSCSDEAAEITPSVKNTELSAPTQMNTEDETTGKPKRP